MEPTLPDGARIKVCPSRTGTYEGRALVDAIKPGNLEVHWPEGNVLLSRDEIDLLSREPDYNAVVTLERVAGSS